MLVSCDVITSVGENFPRLVIYHELHALDTLAPALYLQGHPLHLLPVQHPGLHPGQHHALLHLVDPALDQALAESLHDEQLYALQWQGGLLGK